LNLNNVLKKRILTTSTVCFAVLALVACNSRAALLTASPSEPVDTQLHVIPSATAVLFPTAPPTPEPPPARVLTICLGREPKSLFLYQASSLARSVLQAIYDGPYDIWDYDYHPVILTKLPSMADGDVAVEQVPVTSGDWISDANGNLTNLAERTVYRPYGCSDVTCTQTYTGDQPAKMDQLVVRFRLLPGLLWSDGTSLTADDSAYSFEVAKKLFAPGEECPVM
jgi:peptide/nickel transport system substrate-binding protein